MADEYEVLADVPTSVIGPVVSPDADDALGDADPDAVATVAAAAPVEVDHLGRPKSPCPGCGTLITPAESVGGRCQPCNTAAEDASVLSPSPSSGAVAIAVNALTARVAKLEAAVSALTGVSIDG